MAGSWEGQEPGRWQGSGIGQLDKGAWEGTEAWEEQGHGKGQE